MRRFIREYLATPEGGLSPLSRFVVANGWLYLVLGAGLVGSAPFVPLEPFGAPADAAGLVQVLGVTIALVGWFYVAGGRTGATSFALATVVDRLLVPFVLVPLVMLGGAPWPTLGFAILDPLLALGTLALWRRTVDPAMGS